ncbi:hypothetical protein PO909_013016 [Leuciscus waleckii]
MSTSASDPGTWSEAPSEAAPASLDAELMAILTEAVADMELDWVAPKELPSKKWMDGSFLDAGRQAEAPQRPTPFFPELHEELTWSWRSPHSARAHAQGTPAADDGGRDREIGVFQTRLLGSLDEEGPDPESLRKLRTVADLTLAASKKVAQGIGRNMGSLVVLHRHLWLTGMRDAEKKQLLDAPVSPKGLFSVAVEAFSEKYAETLKQSKMMPHLLPKRSQSPPLERGPDRLRHSVRQDMPGARPRARESATSLNRCFARGSSESPASARNRPLAAKGGRRARKSSVPDVRARRKRARQRTCVEEGVFPPRQKSSLPLSTITRDISEASPPGDASQSGSPGQPEDLIMCVPVQEALKSGYTLQFARRPPRFGGVIMSEVSEQSAPLLRAEISSLLAKQAVEIVPEERRNSGFYSRYFLVPKKDGGMRPILDLRLLNKALTKRVFKMITVKQILAHIQPEDYFIAVDLKDAYFHIQIAPHHRRFLRFAFEGVAYQFKLLPFGLDLAPRVFTMCIIGDGTGAIGYLQAKELFKSDFIISRKMDFPIRNVSFPPLRELRLRE